MNIKFYVILIILLVSFRMPAQTISQMVKPGISPTGAPKKSDVCFTSRNKRDSTYTMAEAFHATRLDWCYLENGRWNGTTDPKPFVEHAHETGLSVCAALPLHSNDPDVWIQTAEGDPIIPSWYIWVDKDNPTNLWGCVNNPKFREEYLTAAKSFIDLGADVLHKDLGGHNYSAAKGHQACFCNYCQEKAAKQDINLQNREQRMTFQMQSTIEFYQDMENAIETYAGREVGISQNMAWNQSQWLGEGAPILEHFDYGMSEISRENANPQYITNISRQTNRLNKALILTSMHEFSVPEYRRIIATCYATGMHYMVPWDEFKAMKNYRYWGRPKDYADLYGFVRASARYLDDYEEAMVIGADSTLDTNASMPIDFIEDVDNVLAVVRAKPNRPNDPVVIHLIDWNKTPEPFTLRLLTQKFFDTTALSVMIHQPALYDQSIHQHAEKSGDYGLLRKTDTIKTTVEGNHTHLSVPALQPWALLVILPKNQN